MESPTPIRAIERARGCTLGGEESLMLRSATNNMVANKSPAGRPNALPIRPPLTAVRDRISIPFGLDRFLDISFVLKFLALMFSMCFLAGLFLLFIH